MLKEELSDGGGHGGNNWARVCGTCRSAACTVYCRTDLAYLCAECDARMHAATPSRHERVWVCEACERAPAALLCKADAASLCAECDTEIHSANPLARRHQRVPILPISGCLYGSSAAAGGQEMASAVETEEDDEDEADSWLLLNPGKNSSNHNNGFLFNGEVEEYLDLVEYNSNVEHQFTDQYNQQQQHFGLLQKSYDGDSVVPVQQQQHHQNFQYGLNYDSSKPAYSYNGSLSYTVSLPSMDVGIVPESTMSDISISHTMPPKGTIDLDLFSGPPIQMPTQLTPMDREARVQRYREKKKTRKFEKTIRYASRKVYAEMRPRIKGRFAKRTDVEIEVDRMFSSTLMSETGYGIVLSF